MSVRPSRILRPESLPARSDLRVGTVPDVHLVTGAGPYEAEVLVRVRAADRIEIVGQITWCERVHEPVSNLEIVLFDANTLEPAARARTDHFGEFNLGSLQATRYYLALGSTPEAPCMLVWEGEE